MGDTFDFLAKGLAERISRRRSLKLMLGGVLGTAAMTALPEMASATEFTNCCFERCAHPHLSNGLGRGACIRACKFLQSRGLNPCELGLCQPPDHCPNGGVCFTYPSAGKICVKIVV